MRKLIDIPEDTKIKLQILAIKKGKDLKNYIQDLLEEHVEIEEHLRRGAWEEADLE